METLAFLTMLFYTIILGAVAIIVVCGAASILWIGLSTIIDEIKERLKR